MTTEQILELASKGGAHVTFEIKGDELLKMLRLVADNAYQSKTDKQRYDFLHTAEKVKMLDTLRITFVELFDKGELSRRAFNVVNAAGISTLGMLCQTTPKDIRRHCRNIGNVTCGELENIMLKNGLHFGMDVTQYGYPKAGWIDHSHYAFIKED